jgi:hypothetical protein
MTKQQIIDIYAHDYRGIAMTQDELRTMLGYMAEELLETNENKALQAAREAAKEWKGDL